VWFRAATAFALIAASCAAGGGRGGACSGRAMDLLNDERLVAGIAPDSPPYTQTAGGPPDGFEIGLLRAVAKRLDLDARFVEQSYSGLFPGVVARRFDVVASGIRADTEATEQICLTEPVLPGGVGVVADGKRNPDIEDLGDLGGRIVGVAEPSVAAEWARAELGSGEVRTYPTIEDAFAELGSGGVDAVVADLPVALHRTKGSTTLRIIGESEAGPPVVWGVHPSNAGLADALDEGLRGVREDGTYATLHRTWFGRPP
jgi:glutamine transport system substrate-binding protein